MQCRYLFSKGPKEGTQCTNNCNSGDRCFAHNDKRLRRIDQDKLDKQYSNMYDKIGTILEKKYDEQEHLKRYLKSIRNEINHNNEDDALHQKKTQIKEQLATTEHHIYTLREMRKLL